MEGTEVAKERSATFIVEKRASLCRLLCPHLDETQTTSDLLIVAEGKLTQKRGCGSR